MNAQPKPAQHQPTNAPNLAPVLEMRGCRWIVIGYWPIQRKAA
jgi:hypothetical protein